MELAGFILEAHTAAREGDVDRMVACEVEAAEALAGLARSSALLGGSVISGELKRQLVAHSQEKLMAAQDFNDFISTRTTHPKKIEKIVENIPGERRGKSCQLISVSKSRPKLTEGEKHARKVRRILANREAARETIRRRQALFLDLNKRAADVQEENENLKKEKALAVEEYNSLKDRNEFLKAQLAKTKKTEPGYHMQEDPKASRSERPCFQPSGPSIVPCFWPPVFPPSDSFIFQCAPHFHDTSSSHFPLFLFPVPCSLSFFAHGSTPHSHYGSEDTGNAHQCSTCLCSEVLPHKSNSHLTTNQNMREGEASSSGKSTTVEGVHRAGSIFPPEGGDEGTTYHPDGTIFVPGLFTRVKPQETAGPARNDVDVGLSQESGTKMHKEARDVGFFPESRESLIKIHKETQDIFAAADARRKRKELMKMRNALSRHHVKTRY